MSGLRKLNFITTVAALPTSLLAEGLYLLVLSDPEQLESDSDRNLTRTEHLRRPTNKALSSKDR